MAEFLVILALLVAGLLIMVPTIKYIVEPLKTLSDFMDDTKANYNPLSQIVVPPVSKKHTAKEIIVLNQTFSNLLQELHEQTERRVEYEKKMQQLRTEMILSQVKPHFLYNTLDTINWKAIELGEFEISEMLGALADILRYTVKNAGAETSIEQELHWLAMYILLQKAKLGRELQVEVKVPEELYGYRIHKLLLQPFVENAIRHGLKQKEGELKLGITMRSAGGQMHIIVKDNGRGIPEDVLQRLNDSKNEADAIDSGEHMGIINVRKRLNLYYGDQADLYFESALGKYTKVHLFIPVVSPHRQADAEGRKEEGQ